MAYELNKLVKQIRIELGYTQLEFAKTLNCTQVFISQIENCKRDVSDDLLFSLSNLSSTDLFHYKSNLSKFRNYDDYKFFYKLVNLTESQMDIVEKTKLAKDLLSYDIAENLDYGDPLLVKNMWLADIEIYLNNDKNKAIEILLSTLKITESDISYLTSNTLKSAFYYSLITVLVPELYQVGKKEFAEKIAKKTINQLDSLWTNTSLNYITQDYFFKKIYIYNSGNYAAILLLNKDYKKCINVCDSILIRYTKEHMFSRMEIILRIKIEALCCINSMDEAKTIFHDLTIISKYSNCDKYLEDTIKFFEENYPELFK